MTPQPPPESIRRHLLWRLSALVALVVLVALHVLAAFKHLFLNRDQVFQRMLPGRNK